MTDDIRALAEQELLGDPEARRVLKGHLHEWRLALVDMKAASQLAMTRLKADYSGMRNACWPNDKTSWFRFLQRYEEARVTSLETVHLLDRRLRLVKQLLAAEYRKEHADDR